MEERDELRQHMARTLEQRADTIVSDASGVLPFAGLESNDLSRRLAELAVQALTIVIRDREIDARSADIAELRRLSREQNLLVHQLFNVVYVIERVALDELALDESFGATSEPWPAIAQLVRRSAVGLLASFAERLAQEAGDEALADPLTTLHTRPVLLAALDKEIQRAERFGHPFALLVFDIDHFAEINARHGYGFGDRVLERIGIVIRNYFREQDWVARVSGDRLGVLLVETPREHAEQLAERVRETIQGRMALRDYRTEEPVPITVSAALLIAESVDASMRADRLLKEAEQAVHRAKHAGRNRIEVVQINVTPIAPPQRDNQPL